jgi:hypothetical protein
MSFRLRLVERVGGTTPEGFPSEETRFFLKFKSEYSRLATSRSDPFGEAITL